MSAQICEGKASYYAYKFNGRRTSNGERFSNNNYVCAHQTLPFNSILKVTSIRTQKSVFVRVIDRCSRKKTSCFVDLSVIAAKQIEIIKTGIANVTIEIIDSLNSKNYKEIIDSLNIAEINKYTYKHDSTNIDTINVLQNNIIISTKTTLSQAIDVVYKYKKRNCRPIKINRVIRKNKFVYQIIIFDFKDKKLAH